MTTASWWACSRDVLDNMGNLQFHNRRRRPGEPLTVLANDIEYMCKRAYNTMPPGVELRVHTLLARPATMNALELAVEGEMLSRDVGQTEESVVRAVSVPDGQIGNPGG